MSGLWSCIWMCSVWHYNIAKDLQTLRLYKPTGLKQLSLGHRPRSRMAHSTKACKADTLNMDVKL